MSKFNMIAAVAVTTSLALAAPAFANSNSNASAAVSAAAKTDFKANAKTKYCFDTESTGSRIAKRVCQTKAQWANVGIDVDREMKR